MNGSRCSKYLDAFNSSLVVYHSIAYSTLLRTVHILDALKKILSNRICTA